MHSPRRDHKRTFKWDDCKSIPSFKPTAHFPHPTILKCWQNLYHMISFTTIYFLTFLFGRVLMIRVNYSSMIFFKKNNTRYQTMAKTLFILFFFFKFYWEDPLYSSKSIWLFFGRSLFSVVQNNWRLQFCNFWENRRSPFLLPSVRLDP